MPIYRQIGDQIRYQVAAGALKPGQQMPSVRQLAGQLAVNQNTILKVYNELCRDGVLCVDRGHGTFVSQQSQSMTCEQREAVVKKALGQAAVQAIQLGVGLDRLQELISESYTSIENSRKRSSTDA